MAAIVVPFRSRGGKRRLEPLPEEARRALGHAMLADVLAACLAVAPPTLVTDDEAAETLAREVGAHPLPDPGSGHAAAVAAALAQLEERPVLVVNADLPCLEPRDVLALLGAIPDGGLAIVPARDGTANALGLASPELFAPLYGHESARRFRIHAEAVGASAAVAMIPNLVDDVDTLEDLERLEARLGAHTRAAYDSLAAVTR